MDNKDLKAQVPEWIKKIAELFEPRHRKGTKKGTESGHKKGSENDAEEDASKEAETVSK